MSRSFGPKAACLFVYLPYSVQLMTHSLVFSDNCYLELIFSPLSSRYVPTLEIARHHSIYKSLDNDPRKRMRGKFLFQVNSSDTISQFLLKSTVPCSLLLTIISPNRCSIIHILVCKATTTTIKTVFLKEYKTRRQV